MRTYNHNDNRYSQDDRVEYTQDGITYYDVTQTAGTASEGQEETNRDRYGQYTNYAGENVSGRSTKGSGSFGRAGRGHSYRNGNQDHRGSRMGAKILAGVLAAGLIGGTAFYSGRVSAASAGVSATTTENTDSTSGNVATISGSTSSSASDSTTVEGNSSTSSAASSSTGTDSTGSSNGTSITLATSSSDDSADLTVTEVAKKGMSSVVAITNTIEYQQNGYRLFGSDSDTTAEAAASGSGVIIGITDDEVLIVTNHHVIEDASELSVQFVDGTSVDASVKGEDTTADLAVISVKVSDLSSDTLSQITAVTFADSDEIEVGEQVVAIGNALGYGQSVTTGIISAKDRDLESSDGTTEEGLLQTDAAINPGNSGGALLNMKGQLVGINVAKYSSTDVEGMGYSIPSNKVAEVVSSLVNKTSRTVVDESERGYLGITTATVNASVASTYDMPQGIYVYSITDGSAAANSELQEGDIITAFDGQNVSDAGDLSDLLKYYKAGETVTLTVERKNASGTWEEKSVEVTLGQEQTTAAQTAGQNTTQQTTPSYAYSFFG